MSIRNRLVLMLTVPLLALVLVAAVGFSQLNAGAERLEDAQETFEETVLVDAIGRNIGLERLGFVSGFPGDQQVDLSEATDSSIDRAISIGTSELATLAESLQATVDQARMSGTDVRLEQYLSALDSIDNFIDGRSTVGFSVDGVPVVQGLQQARVAADVQEETWFGVLQLTEATPQALADASRKFADTNNEIDDVGALSTEAGERFYEAPNRSEVAGQLLALETIVLRNLTDGVAPTVDAAEVNDLLWQSRLEWNEASAAGASFLSSELDGRAGDTNSNRSLFAFLALLGAFLLAVLIFVISRSIVGPLTRLIDEAEAVTTKRLPRAVAELRRVGADDAPPKVRPITRETDDEIGALVDAFNSVQGTAMTVATDQARSRRNVAEMFVNLGRRNQKLNHRMLSLISELERDEQDPDVLQGLYRLDHMATRMRRNAESLLVLAGNRSPRQWSRPVPTEDVVRSALAEVENFERIEVGDIPEKLLRGSVVTDITHLLAELLDNATNFSDPTSSVAISAYETDTGIEIEIADEGLGISESDLVDLNKRVTDPPALDEAPSRLLGLFVVGRLAQEHDVHVHLDSQIGVGTVATVSLPSSMIPEQEHGAPTALQPIDMDPGIGEEVRAELGLDVEPEVVEASPHGDSWNPAATHEVALADATVPTVDEMEEAMPSFPSVTIDMPNPDEQPVPEIIVPSAEVGAGALPLDSVDSPIPELPLRDLHDRGAPELALEPVGHPDEPALPTPDAVEPPAAVEQAVPPAPAPEIPALSPEPEETTTSASVFDLAPPPPVEVTAPAPEQPAPAPVAESPDTAAARAARAGNLSPVSAPQEPAPVPQDVAQTAPAPAPAPAAPTAPMPAPVATVESAPAPMPEASVAAPAPAVDAPEPETSFGGLPVRSPQSSLSEVGTGSVMPLPDVDPQPTMQGSKMKATGAFAAFASGVTRGLDESDDSDSQNPATPEGDVR